MATQLRFDNMTIDGTAIAVASFVSHSGRITLTGDDGAVSTADGKIHNFRRAINFRAEAEYYGDARAFETDGPGLGVTVGFLRAAAGLDIFPDGTDVVSTITALVDVEYDEANKTSRLSITNALDE